MIINNLAMVLGNTPRSQAYIQLLTQHNLFPQECYILTKNIEEIKIIPKHTQRAKNSTLFNIEESLYETLTKNNIKFTIIETDQLNSEDCINFLKNTPYQYLIYSGYGGVILKTPLFHINKTWIHIHAGLLPQFRGSTTVYYSILEKNNMGATAIILNEKIDCGDIIDKEEFPSPPPNIDIDYIYDPYIRAKLLVKIIKNYHRNKIFHTQQQIQQEGYDYYIIHPLLKHLSIMITENNKK